VHALKRMCNDCRRGSLLIPFMCKTFQIGWHRGHRGGRRSVPQHTTDSIIPHYSPDPPLLPSVWVWESPVKPKKQGFFFYIVLKLLCDTSNKADCPREYLLVCSSTKSQIQSTWPERATHDRFVWYAWVLEILVCVLRAGYCCLINNNIFSMTSMLN